MNVAGSYLFEPAGSIHTLHVPESNTEITDVFFAIHGANLNLDADGNVTTVIDAGGIRDFYFAMCEADGHGRPAGHRHLTAPYSSRSSASTSASTLRSGGHPVVVQPGRVAPVQVVLGVEAVQDDERLVARAAWNGAIDSRTALIVPRPASATSTTTSGSSRGHEVDGVAVRGDRRPRAADRLEPADVRLRGRASASSSSSSAIVGTGRPSTAAAIGGAIGTG